MSLTLFLPILLHSLSLLHPFSQHLLTSFLFSLSISLSFIHFSLSLLPYGRIHSPFPIHYNHSLFYSHSIHHNCTIPFPLFPSHSVLITFHLHPIPSIPCSTNTYSMRIPFPFFPSLSVLIPRHLALAPLSSRPSITYSIYIPFPFFLSKQILIAVHLSLTLLLPILHHPHILFPFSASTVILIAKHLSHASLIHLTPLSHSISVPIPHSQPHRCASLSYTSNLFSITHTFIPSFHLHSQFTNPA